MSEQLAYDIIARDLGASRTLDKVGDAADDAGDSLKDLGKDGKQLDKQLAETEKHLKSLITEFDKTGDKELFRGVRKDRSTLNMIKAMRKELEEPAKIDWFAQLRETLSGLPSELKGAAIAAAVGVGALLAPLIGAAVGGAVLGGVGAGGIIGGIALAAQDSRVKKAGAELGASFLGDLQDAGSVFILPLLDQFDDLKRIGAGFTSDLEHGFRRLAPLLKPIVEGLEGFEVNLGPGLADAFEAAEPAIRAIAHELPDLADSISYMLEAISSQSDGATMGLISLLNVVESALEGFGNIVAGLSATYEWLVRATDAVAGFYEALNPIGAIVTPIGMVHDETSSLIKSLDEAKDSSNDFTGSLETQVQQLERERDILKSVNDEFNRLFGIQMSVDEANIRYQKALDDTLETLREGKRTLDINSESGRENKQAILDQITAIENLRDANIDNGMTMDAANGKYQTQLASLEKTLIKLGFNKTEVHNLIAAYRGIPAKVSTDVTAPGLAGVLARMRELDRLYHSSPGYIEYRAGERDPSGHRAAGGPVQAGLTYMVGEHGPEMVTFGQSGTVIPATTTKALMSGASGGSAGGITGVEVLVSAKPGAGRDLVDKLVEALQFEVRTVGNGSVNNLLDTKA